MWDLKLHIVETVFWNSFFLHVNCFLVNNVFTPCLNNGLIFLIFLVNESFPKNLTIWFIFKFILSIMFLILIRGGTPRYRYDYLTKLGWLKFLGFVIIFFLTSIFFYFLF